MSLTTSERIALIYAGTGFGAGLISFLRGRRGTDLLTDAALHGFVAGSVANVGYAGYSYFRPSEDEDDNGYAALEDEEYDFEEEEDEEPAPVRARKNSGNSGLGTTITAEGRSVLASVNYDKVLASRKGPGFKIGESPENPSVVTQDE